MQRMTERMRGVVNASQEAFLGHRATPAGTHADVRDMALRGHQEAYAALERHVAALEGIERAARAIVARVDVDLSVLGNDDWLGVELGALREQLDAYAAAAGTRPAEVNAGRAGE